MQSRGLRVFPQALQLGLAPFFFSSRPMSVRIPGPWGPFMPDNTATWAVVGKRTHFAADFRPGCKHRLAQCVVALPFGTVRPTNSKSVCTNAANPDDTIIMEGLRWSGFWRTFVWGRTANKGHVPAMVEDRRGPCHQARRTLYRLQILTSFVQSISLRGKVEPTSRIIGGTCAFCQPLCKRWNSKNFKLRRHSP